MAKKSDRNNTESSIVHVKGVSALAAYATQDDKSLAGLEQYVIRPRFKVMQAMSKQKDQFPEGSVIVRPGDAVVAEKGETFSFVPLFFFTEFCKWADRKDTESPAIVARTFDPTSDIAKRSMNAEQREELYPESENVKDPKKQKKYRYVQHFCFSGIIIGDHPLQGTECVLSFEKGEFSQGRNFISAIKMRRQDINLSAAEIESLPEHAKNLYARQEDGTFTGRVAVPLWAQRWRLSTKMRTKGENAWWGFDYTPDEPAVIPEDLMESYRSKHLELAAAYEARRLVVDGGEQDEEPDADGQVSANSKY